MTNITAERPSRISAMVSDFGALDFFKVQDGSLNFCGNLEVDTRKHTRE